MDTIFNSALYVGSLNWCCVLDIIPYRSQRKLWSITFSLRIPILISDGARTPIWASQAIEADDIEPREVKSLALASNQRSPPVANVGASGESMAYHQSIIFGFF